MKITQIVQQKRNKNRWNIYMDGDFSFSASLEDIVRYNLKEGREIIHDQLNQIIEACEFTKAYNYSLNALNMRDYTSAALEKKLKDKGYSSITINTVIGKLQQYDIINDERYVIRYVNDSLKLKKYGKNKIMYGLQSKGIPDQLKDKIIIDEQLQYDNCMELAIKKLKQLNGKDKVREKLYRHLITKGYPFDMVNSIIRKIIKDDGCDSE